MSTTIVGLFDEEESAQFLHQEIKKRGIKERDVELLTWKRLDERSDPWNLNLGDRNAKDLGDNLAAHLRNWGVSDKDSRDFARAVSMGGNIVLARCDDDHKIDEITKLMEEKEAVDLDERREMWHDEHFYDEQTPDSVHLKDDMHDRYQGASDDVARAARINTPIDHPGEGLQEAHEELKIGKRRVATGKVRLHKHVEEEAVDEDITLRSDKIKIERRPIDRVEDADIDHDLFEDETVEFTEYAEEPVVEKEVRLDDEFVAKRTVEEHEETIHDTVRKAVVDIDSLNEEIGTERSFDSNESIFREHYQGNYANLGSFDDYSPAYRYGHAFGTSNRYSNRSFDEIEPELRASYESQYGNSIFGPYREAARHAFTNAQKRR